MQPGITYDLPDFGRPVTTRILRQALDATLRHHRTRWMPGHFTADALTRYPVEYAAACPRRGALASRRESFHQSLAERVAGMTPTARAAYLKDYWSAYRVRQRARQAAEMAAARTVRMRSQDRDNAIPLFDTGRLKNAVMTGPVAFRGPVSSRRMAWTNLPRYAYFTYHNTKGTFIPRFAMRAVVDVEMQDDAQVLEREIIKLLNAAENRKRRKSAA